MNEEFMPVLIGVGLAVDREKDATKAQSPLEILLSATEAALADSGVAARVKDKLDAITTVRFVTDSPDSGEIPFGNYNNPSRSLSNALGLAVDKCFYGPTGGNTPQLLINNMAEQIAQGTLGTVLIAGGEALGSIMGAIAQNVDRRKDWNEILEEAPLEFGADKRGVTDSEGAHGLSFPVNIYPILENALRHAKGHDMATHMGKMGALMSPFTQIAAENPYSWFPIARAADELVTAGEGNRWVGYPYPKYLNSVIRVNQAAAVIMTNLKTAREIGVREENYVYLHGCADANDIWFATERPELHRSPAIQGMGETALRMAGWSIDEIDYFDLYSCFPVAVEVARDELGIAENDPRPLTVTGGLPYFGGAGNAYTLLSVALMAQKLRQNPGRKGMCTGNGYYLTKHSMGLYSTTPPQKAWAREAPDILQQKIDAQPHVETIERPQGAGVIESYTIAHPAGKPRMAIVIGRMVAGGARFVAHILDEGDRLDKMMQHDMIGTKGQLQQNEAGLNIMVPNG